MKYQLAIFDMDGTILNTLDDLADSLNAALAQNGFPARTTEEVRCFVGNGIRRLVERGVPASASVTEADAVYASFTAYYGQHCADKTCAYDGIPALLARLRALGMRTAVVSNKADFAVQALCGRYFDGLFDAAVGERTGVQKKPAPDSVNAVLEKLGVARTEAVYIGDSDVDLATAHNACMDCISVDWGFRDRALLLEKGARVIASDATELLRLLM